MAKIDDTMQFTMDKDGISNPAREIIWAGV